MPACAICKHKSRAAIEADGRGGASLDALVDVCAKHGVTRSALERHLAKCSPRTRRARKGAEDTPPSSSEQAPEEMDDGGRSSLPPPRELAAADEELRRQAQLLTRHLERPDLAPREVSQVSNALAAVYRQISAREKGQRPIDEHPSFEGLVEDLVEAVVAELGPRAPDGIEGRIAARLEALQAARAAAPALRRAA